MVLSLHWHWNAIILLCVVSKHRHRYKKRFWCSLELCFILNSWLLLVSLSYVGFPRNSRVKTSGMTGKNWIELNWIECSESADFHRQTLVICRSWSEWSKNCEILGFIPSFCCAQIVKSHFRLRFSPGLDRCRSQTWRFSQVLVRNWRINTQRPEAWRHLGFRPDSVTSLSHWRRPVENLDQAAILS